MKDRNLFCGKKTETEGPTQAAYLNPYMGRVALSDRKNLANVLVLYPIKKGTYNLTEAFYLEDSENIFDGIQSFLITSP